MGKLQYLHQNGNYSSSQSLFIEKQSNFFFVPYITSDGLLFKIFDQTIYHLPKKRVWEGALSACKTQTNIFLYYQERIAFFEDAYVLFKKIINTKSKSTEKSVCDAHLSPLFSSNFLSRKSINLLNKLYQVIPVGQTVYLRDGLVYEAICLIGYQMAC